MTPFEEQLAKALAREEPTQGFADRVMAAADEQEARRRESRRRFGRWPNGREGRWMLAWRLAPALAALLLTGGGALYQQHEQTVHGEQAKEQLLTAMRIAGATLYDAQQRVVNFGGARSNGEND